MFSLRSGLSWKIIGTIKSQSIVTMQFTPQPRPRERGSRTTRYFTHSTDATGLSDGHYSLFRSGRDRKLGSLYQRLGGGTGNDCWTTVLQLDSRTFTVPSLDSGSHTTSGASNHYFYSLLLGNKEGIMAELDQIPESFIHKPNRLPRCSKTGGIPAKGIRANPSDILVRPRGLSNQTIFKIS